MKKLIGQNGWLLFKVALILIVIGQNVYLEMTSEHSYWRSSVPISNMASLVMVFLFGVFGLPFVVAIQYFRKNNGKLWQKPSWTGSLWPFEPLQFFHLATWFMALTTVPIVIMTYFNNPDFIYDALMPFCFGVGGVIGVYLSAFLFRSRIAYSSSSQG